MSREAATHGEQNVVTLTVNGREVRVRAGATVAAAIVSAGEHCRISVSGEPRAPLCGMGICMECRATVDGAMHVRTCQMAVRDGMTVVTG
jgi:D-hydroxyproline dehydrogenase subunit gamma